MKNLKKVLALGLALVMMLGMFTIASAAETKKVATEFSDWATIEHKDAVSLMVDLGIITGKPDGTFDPKGTIDRASWAKMVYFAATGSDDADAYLGTATGLKDIVGKTWAESYISYLAAMKYVSGDNYGNFNPTNNVTVAEANKMMLCVLGWDAEDRGYQNDAAWSGNIMTDAKREGLMKNVDREQTALVPLTRENAAEIVYNALQTRLVEGENGRDNGDKFIVKYNRKAYSLGYDVFGLSSVTLTVKELKDGKAVFAENTGDDGILANNLNEKVSATLSDVGQVVTVFYKGIAVYKADGSIEKYKFDECVSSRVAQADTTPVKVITGGVNWTNTFDADHKDYCGYKLQSAATGDNYKTVTYYVNGDYKGATQPSGIASGNVVELYDFKDAAGDAGSDGLIDTVKVYNYSVKIATGATETRTQNDKLQVRVPGVTSGWVEAAKVEGYDGIAKDDVLLTYSNAGSTVIEKAAKVDGNKISAKDKDNKVTINGTKYAQSALTPAKIGDITTFTAYDVNGSKDNEYNFFLDKNGDVCHAALISEGTDKSKVAIVLDAWENFNGNDGSSVARTKLLFTDGTVDTVDVSKIDGTKIDSKNATTQSAAIKAQAEKAFFNYKVDSNGKYELTEMKDDTNSTEDDWDGYVTTTLTPANGIDQKPAYNAGTTSSNSKTLFIVAKGNDSDGYAYSTYTSFENVPKMDAKNDTKGMQAGMFLAEKAGDPAKYVYIKTADFTGDGADGLYFLVDNSYSIDTNGDYTISVVTPNGVKDTLVVSAEVAQDSLGLNKNGVTPKVEQFFAVKNVNDSNVVTTVDTATDTTAHTIDSIGNKVIKTNNVTYTYDNATVFVVIDYKVDENGGKDDTAATTWTFDTCGSFDPENVEIEAENDGAEDPDKAFDAVSCVVKAETNKPANFVYIVRYANDNKEAPTAPVTPPATQE